MNLAVSPALLPAYLPAKVGRYQSEFPQVDFKVHEVLSGEAEPLLMDYEVDLALVLDPQFSPDTTLVGEMNLIVQVIMDAGHPLATREQLKISDLTAYPLALPSENSNLFMHLERLMLASQIHLKPQIQCSHAAFIQQCTKGSELLSFMLTPNNEDHNLPDGLVARPLAHRKASICAKLLRRGGVEARDVVARDAVDVREESRDDQLFGQRTGAVRIPHSAATDTRNPRIVAAGPELRRRMW